MRAPGGCTMHHGLTADAASMVRQAINLARRRAHAQVTPIHVAVAMLVNSGGILQRACLKSHTHPLQYKALELCFTAALNRLPTTTPSPILGHHSSRHPSLSNALVAAFKRAQAHQRRGAIENQQQHILAAKIEIEQLVVSILDDPSVSRVMREAGFSSPHVKANVEQCVSLEVSSKKASPTPISVHLPAAQSSTQSVKNEDVSALIESLASKRMKKNNTVVVGECRSSCEGVVRAMKDRIERGDVPFELQNVQFLSLPFLSIKDLSREEIDVKLSEVRCLLKSCMGRGIVLCLGDLKWVSEYWVYYGDQRRSLYCPVEHMIMGIRRIVYDHNLGNGRLRILGIANFNTYIKCKTGHPSLETLLDLQALTIPVGGLDFSLKLDSSLQGEKKTSVSGEGYGWPVVQAKTDMDLTFCSYNPTTTSFQREGQGLGASSQHVESSLPPWLQKCKEESIERSHSEKGDQGQVMEPYNKWSTVCSSFHKSLNFSSAPPSPSASFTCGAKLESPDKNDQQKPDLLSNPNSIPNSASSSEVSETLMEKTTEFSAENLQAMCCALEKRVPWQRDVIPDIASTVLKCRAGLVSRKGTSTSGKEQMKLETWMLFLGADKDGKVKVARELAKLVFGSNKSFKSITSSTDESGQSYLDRFAKAVGDDPHRVFYMENVEQVDHLSQKGIMRAMESGGITLDDGQTASLEDAIIIVTSERFSSRSRTCSPIKHQECDDDQDNEKNEDNAEDTSSPLDLNFTIHGDAEYNPVAVLDILESVDMQVLFKIQML